MKPKGKLFFFCGKMGAGKTFQSKLIAREHNAVRISEDEWLAAHFPERIETFDDYLAHSRAIKPFVRDHVQEILKSGANVVMDFPANTARQRAWFVSLCAEIGCAHRLFFLDLTDEQCLARLATRRKEQPERAAFDNEAVFKRVTRLFERPGEDENLNIVRVEAKVPAR